MTLQNNTLQYRRDQCISPERTKPGEPKRGEQTQGRALWKKGGKPLQEMPAAHISRRTFGISPPPPPPPFFFFRKTNPGRASPLEPMLPPLEVCRLLRTPGRPRASRFLWAPRTRPHAAPPRARPAGHLPICTARISEIYLPFNLSPILRLVKPFATADL